MRLQLKIISSAALAMSMIAVPTVVSADEKDVIDYRQNIMRALGAQSAALGQTMSAAAPEENFAAHLEIIALLASTALKSFEPKVLGGESSPEVWAKWADFSEKMNAFAVNSAKVARTVRENGKDAAMGEVVAALPCKSCHDIYQEKKK